MACLKPFGKPVKTYRYDTLKDKPAHETNLLKAIFSELEKYNLWVGHNIINFDWPMLKSRAYILGVPIVRPAFAYDTCKGFQRVGFRTRLNSIGKPTSKLDHAVDFLGFLQEKTGIYPRAHWEGIWEVGAKRKQALDKLAGHCAADLRMTEKLYLELLEHDAKAKITRLS
jgi:DNA polymerase elongation subunit (family B)